VHQVLGARGTTLAHPVSTETKRLWAWRFEYGDERHWSLRLGTAAARAGADRLYPVIAGEYMEEL
jgi:acyl-CoA dehydrogenase